MPEIAAVPQLGAEAVEISVVMPCLNEVQTLGACIQKARAALEKLGTSWEIVIGDNGSTDGSQELARSLGARVIEVFRKGYGHALIAGFNAARGRYLVMGDSDDSYDFGELDRFVVQLRAGAEVVMGSRFKGEIRPGAMPPLHRYFGNPLLTGILNVLFGAGVSDAHCGLRGLTAEAWKRMNLRSGGMEFASEMVIRAAQERLALREVPVTLSKDGRDRPPHLRSLRDGWRHLRFMLMFSPLWLFGIPGALLGVPGMLLLVLQPFTNLTLFGHRFGLHFALFGGTMTLVGFQVAELGLFAKVVFVSQGIGEDRLGSWLLERFRVEWSLLIALFAIAVGIGVDTRITLQWAAARFGPIDVGVTSVAIVASTLLVLGVQLLFAAMFLGIVRSARTGSYAD